MYSTPWMNYDDPNKTIIALKGYLNFLVLKSPVASIDADTPMLSVFTPNADSNALGGGWSWGSILKTVGNLACQIIPQLLGGVGTVESDKA